MSSSTGVKSGWRVKQGRGALSSSPCQRWYQLKVVVVDDSPEIIEVVSLCFQLRWSGAELISAATGTQGLEVVEAENPDVIILDVGLPDIDGFQVLREIRRFSQVPVIMLTVRGEDTDNRGRRAVYMERRPS